MKNLLNYQSSEYDCGPVSLTNAIRFLFEREEVPPEIIKYIMLYCMDSYNDKGEICKRGTSSSAMRFLADWLNQFGQAKRFPISCEFLSGEEVHINQTGRIGCALRQGGVVVLRLFLEVSHYVLLTGIESDKLYLFDPYYEEEDDPELSEEYGEPGIAFLNGQPKRANRLVSIERLNRTGKGFYEMGSFELREAVIVFHEQDPSADHMQRF